MESKTAAADETFVPARYTWLTHKRTTRPGSEFPISSCSLLEYIGVEWCVRIPEREHLRYITGVFNTLANAGNDEAARRAFQVLFEVYQKTEFERRVNIRPCGHGGYGKFVPALCHKEPCATNAQEIGIELTHEFLEFIRTHFWAIPTHVNETVRDLIKLAGSGGSPCAHASLLLIETRKEMARAVIGLWHGVPRDINDELAFAILCGMIYPGIDVCPNTARGVSNKQVNDFIVEQMRASFRNNVEWSGGSVLTMANEHTEKWEHWMTIMGNETPAIMLEMLGKTRASIIGWEGVLEDIRARKTLAACVFPETNLNGDGAVVQSN